MYGLHFESVEELILYIRSMSLYCVMRDGKYVNFSPIPLADYFASDYIEGEIFRGAPHDYEFFDSEEKMRYLYLDFAGI